MAGINSSHSKLLDKEHRLMHILIQSSLNTIPGKDNRWENIIFSLKNRYKRQKVKMMSLWNLKGILVSIKIIIPVKKII